MRALLMLICGAALAADAPTPVPDVVVVPRAQFVQLLGDNLALRQAVLDATGAAEANAAAVRACIEARSS